MLELNINHDFFPNIILALSYKYAQNLFAI